MAGPAETAGAPDPDVADERGPGGLFVRGASLGGEVVGVRCVGGVIVELGPEAAAGTGDEVLDAAGLVLAPGMVNAHTHAAMTLFRSFGDDLALMEWLQTRIWPAEAKLEPDDVYWGTRLACIEMLRSGTTHFFDMYWHAGSAARAAADAGVRATISMALFDGGPSGGDPEKVATDAGAALESMAGCGELVTPNLGPHAVYTVSPRSLEWVGAKAEEDGLGLQIHLAETLGEVEACLEATGLRPPALLDRCGILGPRTVVSHGCWLGPDELELLAAREVTVAAVPASNMKLATGRAFPYVRAASAGVRVGLGTDGPASNNGLDMFSDVRLFALSTKFLEADPSALPAGVALEVAQGRRSPLLGGSDIRVGEPADFLLLDVSVPEMAPGELDANLVYGASSGIVHSAVVAGVVRMRARQVEGTAEVVEQVRTRSARLRSG